MHSCKASLTPLSSISSLSCLHIWALEDQCEYGDAGDDEDGGDGDDDEEEEDGGDDDGDDEEEDGDDGDPDHSVDVE